MIRGAVSEEGTPEITLRAGDRDWIAVIDTGFNGDLELPESLRNELAVEHVGEFVSVLAAGQTIVEDAYLVEFAFDGEVVTAEATFVSSDQILIGTRLISRHRLLIDFPARTVSLERTT